MHRIGPPTGHHRRRPRAGSAGSDGGPTVRFLGWQRDEVIGDFLEAAGPSCSRAKKTSGSCRSRPSRAVHL